MPRPTQAKLFIKPKTCARRDYIVLLLRQLLSQDCFLLFLRYDGISSRQLNALRYLAINHGLTVRLLLRRWLSSVFLSSGATLGPLQGRSLVLYSENPINFLSFLRHSQFSLLLQDFPFLALGHHGLLSQEPFFELLCQPSLGSLRLLQLLHLLGASLLPLCLLPQNALAPLLRLIALRY